MRFNCLLVFGYDVFGLGICFEATMEGSYIELQIGPLNVFTWYGYEMVHSGVTVSLLGRRIIEPEA